MDHNWTSGDAWLLCDGQLTTTFATARQAAEVAMKLNHFDALLEFVKDVSTSRLHMIRKADMDNRVCVDELASIDKRAKTLVAAIDKEADDGRA